MSCGADELPSEYALLSVTNPVGTKEFFGLCAPAHREQDHRRLGHRSKQMVLLAIDCANSEHARGPSSLRTDRLGPATPHLLRAGPAGFTRSAPTGAQRLRVATRQKEEMAYDAQPHGPHRIVDLTDRGQVADWCADLGCTEAQLREAVRMAGPDHMFVQQWIKWFRLI